jgi:hypothetical protein
MPIYSDPSISANATDTGIRIWIGSDSLTFLAVAVLLCHSDRRYRDRSGSEPGRHVCSPSVQIRTSTMPVPMQRPDGFSMFLTKIRDIPRGDVQNTTYKAYALSVGMSVSRIQRFVRKGIHRARGRGSDVRVCIGPGFTLPLPQMRPRPYDRLWD